MAEGLLAVTVLVISDLEQFSVSVMYVSTDALRSSGRNLGMKKTQ